MVLYLEFINGIINRIYYWHYNYNLLMVLYIEFINDIIIRIY